MTQASKRFLKGLLITAVAYSLSILAWTNFIWPSESELAYAVFLALPIAPAVAIVLLFLRFFTSLDELQQRIQLMAIAFASLATGVSTYMIGSLEPIWARQGFYFHATWVLPMLFLYWAVALLYCTKRYQ